MAKTAIRNVACFKSAEINLCYIYFQYPLNIVVYENLKGKIWKQNQMSLTNLTFFFLSRDFGLIVAHIIYFYKINISYFSDKQFDSIHTKLFV